MFSSHFTLLVAYFQKSNRNTKFNQITLDETLGVYGEIVAIGEWAKLSVTGNGNIVAVVDNTGFYAQDLFLHATGEVKVGPWKEEFEIRYPKSSPFISQSLTTLDATLTTLSQNLAPTITISLEEKLGTNNVYGSNSVLTDVDNDLIDDGRPVLVLAPDGLINAFWIRESINTSLTLGNTIVYATFDGTTWSIPQTLPGSLGFNRDLAVATDVDGDLILTWISGDSTGLTINSDVNVALAAYENSDLWYSEFSSGGWLTPTVLSALAGEERWLSLSQQQNGTIWVNWIQMGSGGEILYAAQWDGLNWSAPLEVAQAAIRGQATVLDIGGIPQLIWSQGIDDGDGDPNHTEAAQLYSSIFSNGAWTAPLELTLNELAPTPNISSTTSQGITALGASAGAKFELDLTPPEEVCNPKEEEEVETPANPPVPPGNTLEPIDSEDSSPVMSFDPNEKVGPLGIGGQRVISTTDSLRYIVYFENDPNVATAPAQEVFITDQIDSDLDLSTLRFEEVTFGKNLIAVTGKSDEQMYIRQIAADHRIGATKEWWVDVIGQVNQATREVKWTFRTLDPDTNDLPIDALAGFLPPNDSSGRGEGYVAFNIKPLSSLSDGTLISNQATIVFDTETSIATNVVTNTIGEPVGPVIEVSGKGIAIGNGDNTPSATDGSQLAPIHIDVGSTEQSFTITNNGDMPLSLSATISDRVRLLNNSHGSFRVLAQPISDTLAPGTSESFTVTFDPATTGNFSATVSIGNNDVDENPFTFVVGGEGTGEVDLHLWKTANISVAGLGDPITYTIVVTNDGNLDATSATISDVLPVGLSFVAGSTALEPSEAGTTGDAPLLVNDLTIQAGASITVTYSVTATGAGTLTNQAQVAAIDVPPPSPARLPFR